MSPSPAVVTLATAGAYLLASVPVAYLVGRAWGIDLRRLGTGNPGTSNLWRNAGFLPAAIAGPLSFAQGAGPVGLARVAGWAGGPLAALAGAAAVGNGYSCFLRFRGGRTVAVATGAVLGLSWQAFAWLLAWYAAGVVLRSRLPGGQALGVLVGFAGAPLFCLGFAGAAEGVGAAVLLAVLIARRMDGLADDLRGGAPPRPTITRRLLFDARPGQRLSGPRAPAC